MEVRCDKCQARYRVDDGRIGPQGLTMRCGKCQNIFRVTRAGQVPKPAASTTPNGAPPAPKAPPAAAPGDEAAGGTMMFQTGNVRPAPQKPAPKQPEAGKTMIFGQVVPSAAPAPKPAAEPKAPENGAGATMVFGQAPLPRAPATATPKTVIPVQPQQQAEPAPQRSAEEAPADEPAEAEPPRQPGTFDKAPPKALFVAVGALLAIAIIGGGSLFALRKFGTHAPPPAAVETLTTARMEADKDTLASLADAEAKARDALELAGARADFPQARALLARVEVQWADALAGQAAEAPAESHLASAYAVLKEAVKADPKSAELQLALADYYRARRSGSNMNKALHAAQARGADDGAVALVEGMALAQEDDGAQKAIPRLKAALSTNPQSARVHFRLALAYLAVKDTANASAELKETLRISPQHERARAAMEQLATANANGK